MDRTHLPTFLEQLSRGGSRLALAAFAVGAIACVAVSVSPYRIAFYDRNPRPSDLELYWSEVELISQGMGYYEAAARELKDRGYSTGSILNWRTPMPMWLLGKLPNPIYGKLLLCIAATGVLVAGIFILRSTGTNFEAVFGGLLLVGATLPCFVGRLYVSPELWGGVFIALSICAYGLNRPIDAVALGITAASLRELAIGYCILMAITAAMRRERRELVAWAIGMIAYVIFFAVHANNVAHVRGAIDAGQTTNWLQFNGLPFLIACVQMNALLLLMPQWVSAIYLSCAIAGMASWTGCFGYRLSVTLCGYLIVFFVFGYDRNQYWGSVIAPLFCFATARSIRSLGILCRVGFSSPNNQ